MSDLNNHLSGIDGKLGELTTTLSGVKDVTDSIINGGDITDILQEVIDTLEATTSRVADIQNQVDEINNPGGDIPVESFNITSLASSITTLQRSTEHQIVYEILPEDATDKTITWEWSGQDPETDGYIDTENAIIYLGTRTNATFTLRGTTHNGLTQIRLIKTTL